MHRSLIVAVSAAALLAACGPKAENTAANIGNAVANAAPEVVPENVPTTPSPPSAGGPATAANFVTQAASSDMFEIAAAKIAASKASSKAVKDFAAMMVKDHTKSTAALKTAIKDSDQPVVLPDALPSELQSKLDELMSAAPADFDKAYMDGQVDAHEKALDLLTGYAKGGDTPAFKTFADTTSMTVQMHLDHAKMVRDALK